MEIIRSKMSITHDQTGCAKFMSDLATNSVGASAYDSEHQRIYITESVYIEYTDTNSDNIGNELRLYDTNVWNGGHTVITGLNGSYINFQIFKYSETCFAVAVATNNNPLTEWNNVPIFAVDTHGANTDMMVITGVDGTSIKAADGASANVTQPWAYKGSDSKNAAYQTTQILPLIVPRSGYICDNLHTVLFTPLSSGQLVSLDVGGSTKMYYFSNGLAIPCNLPISYTYLT